MNLTGKGGFSERKQHINRKGRPRSFNQIRALAQNIAHEKIANADGAVMTRVEAILRSWATCKQPVLQLAFISYCYGKVPDKVEMSGADGEPLKPMVIQVITNNPVAARVN